MNIKVVWKITAPGESTAFCPSCDVELGLSEVYLTEANPVYPENHGSRKEVADASPCEYRC